MECSGYVKVGVPSTSLFLSAVEGIAGIAKRMSIYLYQTVSAAEVYLRYSEGYTMRRVCE